MSQTLTSPQLRHASSTTGSVIVLGGGLAGLAAALALESAGWNVTLIEARKTLGGRASSFNDPKTGQELDNCQHLLLGCCTNLRDLYRRLQSSHRIRWERTLHFRDAAQHYDLSPVRNLPAPLHFAPPILGFSALSLRQRWSLVRSMSSMIRLGRQGREQLADLSFGDWLDRHPQRPGLIDRFYDPVLRGALNEEPRRASAKYAIQVFQDAILRNAAGYVLGLPSCPLSHLYQEAPCSDLRLGTRAAGLRFRNASVVGIELADGQVLTADAYVLAVNHHTVSKWIPSEQTELDSRFAGLASLQSVPILGAHLWFDRPVMAETHTVLLQGPLQWVFRKDRAGRELHGVISAARDWVNRPHEQSLAEFQHQIRRLLPTASNAVLERGLVIVEKRATFAPLPSVDRWRPPQAPPPGGIANLFLAGDYTRTDWPATMEGAVRSGYLAAEAIIRNRSQTNGNTPRFLVPDIPPQWPWRLLAPAE